MTMKLRKHSFPPVCLHTEWHHKWPQPSPAASPWYRRLLHVSPVMSKDVWAWAITDRASPNDYGKYGAHNDPRLLAPDGMCLFGEVGWAVSQSNVCDIKFERVLIHTLPPSIWRVNMIRALLHATSLVLLRSIKAFGKAGHNSMQNWQFKWFHTHVQVNALMSTIGYNNNSDIFRT